MVTITRLHETKRYDLLINNERVATCYAKIPQIPDKEVEIYKLFVPIAARRKGYGKGIINYLKYLFPERGIKLYPNKQGGQQLVDWYLKQGFAPKGKALVWYGI
jgi:N-acetylglutamate synthase-like GNAT family acetyltransferase